MKVLKIPCKPNPCSSDLMTDFKQHSLPGAGYVAILEALELDPEATVGDVLGAIKRLQEKAGRKPRRVKHSVISMEEKRRETFKATTPD